ncbi:hypothetical protein [Dictyobacter arantiisoli]|uniref:Uncharacterized protein n=1 Tax=Dictyobacter arantiisoli TaxID=2014874 RepID=A0A5A5T8E4_9CHLR|nr:hypothetical protein [Dictyobacter arantiisoli]GCF07249.1 hypothetical protein KDI_08130 [Dictyobacter arantiisoli]
MSMFDDLNRPQPPVGPTQSQSSFDPYQPPAHFTLSQPPQARAAFFEQPSKKSKKLFWIIGAVLILALCICMGSLSVILNGSTHTAATPHAAVSSVMQATTTALPATSPGWAKIQEFSGHGLKKTAVFPVASTWKLKYTCSGLGQGIDGVLSVLVYTPDGTMQDMAVNTTCKDGTTTSDETILHQGGSVYLDINATGDWTLQIDEQK